METIAVLLTVHNRRESTLKCLQRVYMQSFDKEDYSIDVYLTDDGSTDGTGEAIRKLYPQVKVINGDGTLFWNRGMIAAWKEAAKREYDFYLWLNDDTFIYDDVVLRLLQSSKQHEDNAIIVGTTCAVGNRSIITYGGLVDGHLIVDTSTEHLCDRMNGNIVLIPKSVFDMLGTNDAHFRHNLGDADYCMRARKYGIEVLTAKGILGECNTHERPTVWMDPAQPLKKRWNNFFGPLGNNPFEFFYFRNKHYGLIAACCTFVSNFVHFLFPWFWKRSYQVVDHIMVEK